MNFTVDELIAQALSQIDADTECPEEMRKARKEYISELYKQKAYPLLELLESKGYISFDSIPTLQSLIQALGVVSEKLSQQLEQKPAKPAVKVQTRKPKKISLETSKIGKELRDAKHRADYYFRDGTGTLRGCNITTGHIRERKGKRYEVKPVQSILMLEYDTEKLRQKGIEIPAIENQRLTTFDLEVLTHCITLLKEGNEYVTAEMIYRLMNGGQDKELYPAMRKRIYDALRRLDCSRMYIDTEKEFDAGLNVRTHYEGTLLPTEFMFQEYISLNGQIVEDCIHFLKGSPLYDYSEAKHQISSFPVEWLAIPGLNGTEQNILLTHYLARFIVEASNDKNPLGNIRLYSTIYEYLEIDAEDRTITARVREATRTILTAWAEKGIIKGFEELTEDDKPARPRVKVAKIRVKLIPKQKLLVLTE